MMFSNLNFKKYACGKDPLELGLLKLLPYGGFLRLQTANTRLPIPATVADRGKKWDKW
jgi:hypothetical protein